MAAAVKLGISIPNSPSLKGKRRINLYGLLRSKGDLCALSPLGSASNIP